MAKALRPVFWSQLLCVFLRQKHIMYIAVIGLLNYDIGKKYI